MVRVDYQRGIVYISDVYIHPEYDKIDFKKIDEKIRREKNRQKRKKKISNSMGHARGATRDEV